MSATCDLHRAAAALANLTDICEVFAVCDKLPHDCLPSARVSTHVAAQLQGSYGAFREAFLLLGVPGSNGEELAKKSTSPKKAPAVQPQALVYEHAVRSPLYAEIDVRRSGTTLDASRAPSPG